MRVFTGMPICLDYLLGAKTDWIHQNLIMDSPEFDQQYETVPVLHRVESCRNTDQLFGRLKPTM